MPRPAARGLERVEPGWALRGGARWGRRLVALAVALALAAGCGGPPTPKDQAEATRRAMPSCRAGDAGACGAACESGGPNESCKRACDGGSAQSCALLASRLERGKDADDALSPVRDVGEQDPELVTATFQRACELGHGPSCLTAGGRILNGQGRGRRGGDVAVALMKRGCEVLRDAPSCCAMSALNARLAEGGKPNVFVDYADEAKKWRAKAKALELECEAVSPP